MTGRPALRRLGAVRTAAGGLPRHKVQTVVLFLVLLIATASATLGFALLQVSNGAFQRAFASQRGADLAVIVDPARASTAELARTARLPGVTAASGPFSAVTAAAALDNGTAHPTTLVSRPSPDGSVDDLVLTAGHWPDGPGQVALNDSYRPDLGRTITVTSVAGSPRLTIVALANSVTGTADGWVIPAEITRLHAAGARADGQMLYRFTDAATSAQLRADAAEIARALPAGAFAGASPWLAAQSQSAGKGDIMEPFIVAFAVIGLVMAVVITANVVSGAVVAEYHRIGILKSIGFTPAKVVAVYLSRVGWPTLAGCLVGVVAGNLLATPVLNQSADAYGVGSQQVPLWASAAAPLGMLVLTVLAASGPALRAGRLSAIAAIAAGRAPSAGRGFMVHRLAGRLWLPRPVGLGLAAPFARPARTMVSLVAIALGTCAVIFAFGLSSSLGRAAASQDHSDTVQVQVQQNGNGSPPTAAQNGAVTATLATQPGIAHYAAVYTGSIKATSISSQDVDVQVFGGDASWIGFAIVSGRWYDTPGAVNVNAAFLADSGLAIGDTTAVYTGSALVQVRIAGEVFDPYGGQPRLYASAQTLPGIATSQNLNGWYVGLRPGVNVSGYVRDVNAALGPRNPWAATPGVSGDSFYTTAASLVATLALMVAVAAGLGVLNTVLMTTRDRVHDLGIFKALGMRPAQVMVMVMCWVAGPAVIGAAIAAPVAVLLNDATVRATAGTAHTGIPASFTEVLPPSRLALLSLAALVIAVAGALLPGSWAARARPVTALHAE